MITLTFILIAYVIRKRFLYEDASFGDKVMYYGFSVIMTPIFGPWFFKKLIDSKPADPNKKSTGIFPYVG